MSFFHLSGSVSCNKGDYMITKIFPFLRSFFSATSEECCDDLSSFEHWHQKMDIFVVSFHGTYSEHDENALKIQYRDWIFFLNTVSLFIISAFIREAKKIPEKNKTQLIEANLAAAQERYPDILAALENLSSFIHPQSESPTPECVDTAITLWLFFNFFDKNTVDEEDENLIAMCDHIRLCLVQAHIDMLGFVEGA